MGMTYEQWRKLAVSSTDLRPMGIDGFQDYLDPVPGIAFMKPIRGEFRGHRIVESFSCLGYITQDVKRGMWDVLIGNTEKEFVSLENAARYLWDNWYKSELESTPYRLLVLDREGEIVFDHRCVSEQHMLEMAVNQLPDPDDPSYGKENCEADLSRVGARFHEFCGGHMVAFPLEED